jgi:FixJ family two-component response regulator
MAELERDYNQRSDSCNTAISEITVKAHRGKVMQKMKADSLADLVKTAVRLRLAPARNPWQK